MKKQQNPFKQFIKVNKKAMKATGGFAKSKSPAEFFDTKIYDDNNSIEEPGEQH
jgi:hypothetical protein